MDTHRFDDPPRSPASAGISDPDPDRRRDTSGLPGSVLRSLVRPIYRLATGNPVFRRLFARELRALGATSWTAHLIEDFIRTPYGRDYGVSAHERRSLIEAFQRNVSEIESGTSAAVHVLLAREILQIPSGIPGDVVECGVWKGACSASLSLVCQRTGRRLKVCDSFQGLPDEGPRRHVGLHTRVYGYYQPGQFAGSVDDVRANIQRCGAIEVCDFIPGFFEHSLRQIEEPVAFAFLDVDLESSTRDCLSALWPRLVDDGLIYSDDAGDLEVVRVYFDEPWWQATLGCPAPGFVGSGCGLPLSPAYSSIGYTRKLGVFDPAKWRRMPFLHYPEEESD